MLHKSVVQKNTFDSVYVFGDIYSTIRCYTVVIPTTCSIESTIVDASKYLSDIFVRY